MERCHNLKMVWPVPHAVVGQEYPWVYPEGTERRLAGTFKVCKDP